MTHSLFLGLLLQSYFSQLQSQVILNNSPADVVHSNVIRALTSLTILLHTAFQMVNAFFFPEPPLPLAPGAEDFYSSIWIHHCSPMATTALILTSDPHQLKGSLKICTEVSLLTLIPFLLRIWDVVEMWCPGPVRLDPEQAVMWQGKDPEQAAIWHQAAGDGMSVGQRAQ